jgi:hypothetical protein
MPEEAIYIEKEKDSFSLPIEVFFIMIDSEDTIMNIKAKIEGKKKFPIKKQILTFNDEVLGDNILLSSKRKSFPDDGEGLMSQKNRLQLRERNSELNAEISLTQSEIDEAARHMKRSAANKQERGDLALAKALSMAPGSFRGGPSQMSSDGQVKARVNQDYLVPSFASAMPCKVDDVVTFLGVDGEWARVSNQSGEVGWVPYSFLEFKRAEPERDPDEIRVGNYPSHTRGGGRKYKKRKTKKRKKKSRRKSKKRKSRR